MRSRSTTFPAETETLSPMIPLAEVGPRPLLLGLVGENIQASLTPEMQMREAEAHGLRCVYRLVDLVSLGVGIAALPELIAGAERLGFDGLNITYPCKQAVIPLLTHLSPDARALGAVNTVLFRDGQRIGHNTDWSGFAESFRRRMAGVPLRRVVQLGAGGAGAAVAHAALTLGVEHLTIFDVDSHRADALAAQLDRTFAGRADVATILAAAVEGADGLINATPVGMAAHPGLPMAAELLHARLWVADVVYVPQETALLCQARAIGCRTLDGGGMAVFQAVGAFRLFTGLEPDVDRMLTSFDAIRSGTPAQAGVSDGA